MEPDMHQLAALFPSIAAQLRSALSNVHLAAALLAPQAERERDPGLDAKAALLDQSYYQLLRLVYNLNSATLLRSENPFPLKDQDLVELIRGFCLRADSLAHLLGLNLQFVCEMEQHLCAIEAGEVEHLFINCCPTPLNSPPLAAPSLWSCGPAATGCCFLWRTPAAALTIPVCPLYLTAFSTMSCWTPCPTASVWACPFAAALRRATAAV